MKNLWPTKSGQSSSVKSSSEINLDYLLEEADSSIQIVENVLVVLSIIVFVLTLPISIFFALKLVYQYEKAVVFRLGRLKPKTKGPGLVFLIPCIDGYEKLDLRTSTFQLPPQEILTKDSCSIAVLSVLMYHIENPIKVIGYVEDYKISTRYLALTALRTIMGQKTLMEILTERKKLAESISKYLEPVLIRWGVRVERVEITDMALPTEMKRAMAASAEAFREAKAKTLNANGELESAQTLVKAANILASNSIALQLRYLQTLQTVAAQKNNKTVTFPLPSHYWKDEEVPGKSMVMGQFSHSSLLQDLFHSDTTTEETTRETTEESDRGS